MDERCGRLSPAFAAVVLIALPVLGQTAKAPPAGTLPMAPLPMDRASRSMSARSATARALAGRPAGVLASMS